MARFVKLFETILDSSIWAADAETTKVWLTMMAMADRDGVVLASVGGLARRAVISREKTEEALAMFMSPDPDSRSRENDGRRIEAVDGGWRLLNYEKYRELMSREDQQEKASARQARWRTRHQTGEKPSVTVRNAGERQVTLGIVPERSDRHTKAEADPKAEDPGKESGEAARPPSPPPLAKFPCVGAQQTWNLTKDQVIRWKELFPGHDVVGSCREALAWIEANPSRRKTYDGMPRFLASWITRNVNRGARAAPAQQVVNGRDRVFTPSEYPEFED